MTVKFVVGDYEQMLKSCLANKHVDAVVIHSNSVIKQNGKATLPPEVCNIVPFVWYENNSRQVRCETRTRLAYLMKKNNAHRCYILGTYSGKNVISMPTKFNWHGPEDPSLIEREALRLVQGCEYHKFTRVALMRPISDDKVWEAFKERFIAILEKSSVIFGVYWPSEEPEPYSVAKEEVLASSVKTFTTEPTEAPEKSYEGKFKDLPLEEQKRIRKERAAKGKKTKEANKKKAEEEALAKEQELRVKRIEAEISDVLDEI
jgi:hypothetical protein